MNSSPGTSEAPDTERTWAILCHLSIIIGTWISIGWLSFVGPLVFWLIYKNSSKLVRGASAGAFNFAITMWIANVVAWILQFTIIFMWVGWIIWLVEAVVTLLFPILGAIRASKSQIYRYPMTIPILK